MPDSDVRTISTDRAPAAIGPYSQALIADGWIYTSGQIPLDPGSGVVVDGGIAEQTHQVMRNLSAILTAAGGGLDTVVKTTVYLADMGQFGQMNEVYSGYFQDHRPARSTVEVSALPKGVGVEMDAVARLRG